MSGRERPRVRLKKNRVRAWHASQNRQLPGGFRSGLSRTNTALLERLVVHKPFNAGTGLKSELTATLLQVAPQSFARLEFAWLTVSRLRIERLNNGVESSHGPKILAIQNIELYEKLGLFNLFHPSDPRNGSHLVSGLLDPYLLSGFPQPARCDASSLFADIDHVC